MKLVGVALALVLSASCKKSDDYFANKGAVGSAAVETTVVETTPDDKPGDGSGSAAPQVAKHDPWAGLPPGADTDLGANCGPKLNQIDPWAGTPKPKQETKVDVASIEKPKQDKVDIKDFGGISTTTGFKVTYNPGAARNHEAYRKLFVDNKMLEHAAAGLNRTVRLASTIDINTVTCRTINAFYDPLTKRIIVCYELLDYFVDMFKSSAKNEKELGNAVMGATMFGFFHEVGHGLIHVLDLPAVGREEDSVDQLATLILIASGEKGVAQALAGAYWFQLQGQSSHKTPFWDEHAFDQQRFYNIVCLIFGSDPKKYGDFIKSGTLPMERARRCPDEYAKIKKAWEKLLQPHLTNGAALNIDYQPTVATDEVSQKTTEADPWREDDARQTPTKVPASGPITCEQVARKAALLIATEALNRARKLSREEYEKVREKLAIELPAAIEKIIAECAKQDWSDESRRCVLDAKTLDDAAKCN